MDIENKKINKQLVGYILKSNIFVETVYNKLPRDIELQWDVCEYLYKIDKLYIENYNTKSVKLIGNENTFYKVHPNFIYNLDKLTTVDVSKESIKRIMVNNNIYIYNMYLYIKDALNELITSYKNAKNFIDDYDKILGDIDLGPIEKELSGLKNKKISYIKNTKDNGNITKYRIVISRYRTAYKANALVMARLNITNSEKLYIVIKCNGYNKITDFDIKLKDLFDVKVVKLETTNEVPYIDYISIYNKLISTLDINKQNILNNAIEADYNKLFKGYEK